MNIINVHKRRGIIVSAGNLTYESEYESVLDFALANSIAIPSSAQNLINNDIIRNLKSIGIWSEMDLFYLFQQTLTDSEFAKINWVNPSAGFNCVQIGTPLTFVNSTGFLGNGSGYFTTNWKPFSDGIKATTGNVSVGARSTGYDNSSFFGCRDTSANNFFNAGPTTFLSSNTVAGIGGQLMDSNTLWVKDGTNQKTYHDGSIFLNQTVANNTLSNRDLFIFSRNLGSGGNKTYDNQSGKYFYVGSKLLGNFPNEIHQILNGTF